MVSVQSRREAARYLSETKALSLSRSCRLLEVGRSSYYYRSERPKRDDKQVRSRLIELAQQRRRFGYERLYVMLRREGFQDNHKRIERIYREEGLSVRRKRSKKRSMGLRIVLPGPTAPDQRWSMDFVTDSLDSGRRFRALTIVDDYSREAPAIEVDHSLPGLRVTRVLERLALTRSLPKVLVMDNGPEFAGKDLDQWAYRHGIALQFIRPGKPVENAYIESFNGKFRDECLNENVFSNIQDAREKIESWRKDYNDERPHSSLDFQTPKEFLQKCQEQLTAKKNEPTKLNSVQL